MILMQVSLYPLGLNDLSIPLNEFWDMLKKNDINFKICPLSTAVWHEDEEWLNTKIFALYKNIREKSKVVMVTTITTGSSKDISELIAFLK